MVFLCTKIALRVNSMLKSCDELSVSDRPSRTPRSETNTKGNYNGEKNRSLTRWYMYYINSHVRLAAITSASVYLPRPTHNIRY